MSSQSRNIGIINLPNELFCHIAEELDSQSDLKSLRSTCSCLNSAFEPLLFSQLSIDTSQIQALEDLSTGRTRAGRYVRRLRIESLSLEGLDAEPMAIFSRHLGPALNSLKSLVSIDWTVDEDDSAWALEQIINSLSSNTNVTHLSLYLRRIWANPLIHPLRHICRFKSLETARIRVDDNRLLLPIAEGIFHVNRLHLKQLELDGGLDWTLPADGEWEGMTHDTDLSPLFRHGEAPLLSDIRLSNLSLAHSPRLLSRFKSLQCLHLERCILGDFWQSFSAAGIELREIAVDYVDNDFLEYVKSYSGLERIGISFNGIRICPYTNNIVAEEFYTTCLNKHVHTLKSIAIFPKGVGRWCLDSENTKVLKACTGLEELMIGVNVDGGSQENGKKGDVTQLFDLANSYANLRSLVVVLKGHRLPWDIRACAEGVRQFKDAFHHHSRGSLSAYTIEVVVRIRGLYGLSSNPKANEKFFQ